MFQIEVVENFLKKLSGRVSLSPLGVELRDSKDCHVSDIIIMCCNGEIFKFTLKLDAAKITDYIEKYVK